MRRGIGIVEGDSGGGGMGVCGGKLMMGGIGDGWGRVRGERGGWSLCVSRWRGSVW